MNRFSIEGPIRRLLFVVAMFGAFAALVSAQPALAGDTDAEAKALAKIDDDWSNAAGRRDADLVASFYAEVAVAYPPDEPVAIGRAAAKRVWAAYLADPTYAIS